DAERIENLVGGEVLHANQHVRGLGAELLGKTLPGFRREHLEVGQRRRPRALPLRRLHRGPAGFLETTIASCSVNVRPSPVVRGRRNTSSRGSASMALSWTTVVASQRMRCVHGSNVMS